MHKYVSKSSTDSSFLPVTPTPVRVKVRMQNQTKFRRKIGYRKNTLSSREMKSLLNKQSP